MNQFVYILKCGDGGIYTGCTNNIEQRLERHQKGYVHSTKNRGPVKLLNYIAFEEEHKAFEFEKYLKTGSGRAFISKRLL